jgi:hypothetical protein
MTEEEVDSIKRDIYIDLVFDAIILLLVIVFGKDSSCGIPVFMWCIVYFIILAARSLSNLVKIVIIRTSPASVPRFSIISFVVIDGLFLAWLIYGNVLFWSNENDCNVISNSFVMYNLMLILIIIGYFQMLVYALLICCLPCIIYALTMQVRDNRPGGQLSG